MPDRLPSEMVQLDQSNGQSNGLPELVVISGKGGTGKTSIVASFFALAEHAAVADCDVDAADLHLVLGPTVRQRRPFSGGSTAVIDSERCTSCGVCIEHCRFDAIRASAEGTSASYEIDALSCEGCGVCMDICPETAALVPCTSGAWYVSETRHGPMVHARLGMAQESSGKLVSLVRREAKAVARSSREVAAEMEADAARRGIPLLGRIRYDESVTAAQVKQLTVVEDGESPAAADIRALWEQVETTLERT